jgi:hypothetical protein
LGYSQKPGNGLITTTPGFSFDATKFHQGKNKGLRHETHHFFLLITLNALNRLRDCQPCTNCKSYGERRPVNVDSGCGGNRYAARHHADGSANSHHGGFSAVVPHAIRAGNLSASGWEGAGAVWIGFQGQKSRLSVRLNNVYAIL